MIILTLEMQFPGDLQDVRNIGKVRGQSIDVATIEAHTGLDEVKEILLCLPPFHGLPLCILTPHVAQQLFEALLSFGVSLPEGFLNLFGLLEVKKDQGFA